MQASTWKESVLEKTMISYWGGSWWKKSRSCTQKKPADHITHLLFRLAISVIYRKCIELDIFLLAIGANVHRKKWWEGIITTRVANRCTHTQKVCHEPSARVSRSNKFPVKTRRTALACRVRRGRAVCVAACLSALLDVNEADRANIHT